MKKFVVLVVSLFVIPITSAKADDTTPFEELNIFFDKAFPMAVDQFPSATDADLKKWNCMETTKHMTRADLIVAARVPVHYKVRVSTQTATPPTPARPGAPPAGPLFPATPDTPATPGQPPQFSLADMIVYDLNDGSSHDDPSELEQEYVKSNYRLSTYPDLEARTVFESNGSKFRASETYRQIYDMIFIKTRVFGGFVQNPKGINDGDTGYTYCWKNRQP